MKRLFLVLLITLLLPSLYSQQLYKDIYFGQSKSDAKAFLPDTTFHMQFGNYVSDKLTGMYKNGVLIAISLDQRLKTVLSLHTMFSGSKGKEATWNTMIYIRDAFLDNGYSIDYENTFLNIASGNVFGSAHGTNYILKKDSILLGIGYLCTPSQVSNSDEYTLFIHKTSILINDADYKALFFIDRPRKNQSDIF